MKGEERPVWIGCSGWNYRDWRELVYPKDLPARHWLEHYATLFDTVEVNATFYRLPSHAAVASWAEQTPPGFLFAVKASRFLTHVKRLTDLTRGVERFYERIEPLAGSGKLGPVLWQLPESFHRDDERLGCALERLPQGRHCFEFRHASWFSPDVYALLREHDSALVIGDHPERPFQQHELTAGWTYVRFHYGRRGRGGNYSERELEEWKRRLAGWRGRVEVFAYFNNDWGGYAVRNAQCLARGLTPRRRPGRRSGRSRAGRVRPGRRSPGRPGAAARWASVEGWWLEVRVYFATQHPSRALLAEAQAELNRLLLQAPADRLTGKEPMRNRPGATNSRSRTTVNTSSARGLVSERRSSQRAQHAVDRRQDAARHALASVLQLDREATAPGEQEEWRARA